MHITGRISLTAGGALAGGYGTHKFLEFADARTERHLDQVERETAHARQEWNAWRSSAEREFPGLRLDTPADHRRFAAFLKRNPAPAWVKVSHEDFTRVRLTANSPLSDDAAEPNPQGFYYGVAAGGGVAAFGASMAVKGLRGGASSTAALVGKTAGGAALAAFGVPLAIDSVQAIARGSKPYEPAEQLVHEVNAAG